MRNRTYGGVRGRKTKVGRKLLRFPPTRLLYDFSTATILRRRHAGVFFEVFAEERLVGEVQLLRNLLNALLRVAQQHTQLDGDVRVDPLVGRALRYGFDCLGEILWRYAELLRVPTHAALRAEVLLDELYELREYLLGTCVATIVLRLHAVDDVRQLVCHGEEHRLHHLAAEAVLWFVNLRLYAEECLVDEVEALLRKAEYGVVACEEEERRQLVNALYRLVEEFVVDEYAYAATVGRERAVVNRATLVDDDEVAGLNVVLHRVDVVAHGATQAHGKQQTLHTAWLARNGYLRHFVE